MNRSPRPTDSPDTTEPIDATPGCALCDCRARVADVEECNAMLRRRLDEIADRLANALRTTGVHETVVSDGGAPDVVASVIATLDALVAHARRPVVAGKASDIPQTMGAAQLLGLAHRLRGGVPPTSDELARVVATVARLAVQASAGAAR